MNILGAHTYKSKEHTRKMGDADAVKKRSATPGAPGTSDGESFSSSPTSPSAHPASRTHRGRLRSLTRAKLTTLWSSSLSSDRIGAVFGVSGAAVRWKAKALGLPPRGRDHVAKSSEADFSEMWLAGVHAGEMAEHFGYSHRQCVGERAKRLGLPKRKQVSRGDPSAQRRNGWAGTITLQQFREQQLARLMAEARAGE